uniref:Uncharacterized protein n=1 Tax=Rhizophora mucronata TaxID=61149 RepID=A0A2P2KKX6_RHIMU
MISDSNSSGTFKREGNIAEKTAKKIQEIVNKYSKQAGGHETEMMPIKLKHQRERQTEKRVKHYLVA